MIDFSNISAVWMDQTSLSAIWRFGQADPPSGTLLWILSGSDPEPPVTTAAVYAVFADITNPNNPTYFDGPEYVYTIDWWNDETGDYGNGTYLAGAGPLDKTEDPDNGISSGSYVSMYMDDWENPIPLPSPSSEYMSWSSYNTSFTYTGGRDHGVFFTQRIPTSITIAGTWNVHYTDQYDQPKTDTGVFNATLTKKR